MTQQGDVSLFQTTNDGDIAVENGSVKFSNGLDTAVYLSLFGGNEDCSGRDTCPFTWWGNVDETDSSKKYISETQFLLKSLPLITSNLRRIEDAAKRDLNWFLENNIASSIIVNATIPGLNLIRLFIIVEANGLESSFEFVENWKASL